jgi:hypothetical protein
MMTWVQLLPLNIKSKFSSPSPYSNEECHDVPHIDKTTKFDVDSDIFLLRAKVRACEEHMQHLRDVITEQEAYIQFLEGRSSRKRRNSI